MPGAATAAATSAANAAAAGSCCSRVPVVQFPQFSVYDEPHDLIGALQDAVHTQVTQVPLNRVVLGNTSTQQRTAAAAHRQVSCQQLPHMSCVTGSGAA